MPLNLISPDTRTVIDAMMPGQQRTDGLSGSAFFERELESRIAEVLQEKRAPLLGFELFPVDTSIPAGAETWLYEAEYDLAVARRIANWGDDLPTSEVEGKEFARRIVSYGSAATWSVQEVYAAQMSGRPIPTRKMMAARDAIERTFHRALWYGDQEADVWGVFSHPLVPRTQVAIELQTASADDVIGAINGIVNGIVDRAKNTLDGAQFDVLLPSRIYSRIATAPRSTTSDTTILAFLVQNNPRIRSIRSAWTMDGAGPDDRDCVVVVPVAGTELPRFMVALPPTPQPVQARNLSLQVPMYGRTGGVFIPRPLEMEIAELPA